MAYRERERLQLLLVVIKRVCPRNESASFQLPMCIKKIPKGFHVIIEEEHPVVGTSDQCRIPTLPIHATSQVQRVWQGIHRHVIGENKNQ